MYTYVDEDVHHILTKWIECDIVEHLERSTVVDVFGDAFEDVRLEGPRPAAVRLPVVMQTLHQQRTQRCVCWVSAIVAIK